MRAGQVGIHEQDRTAEQKRVSAVERYLSLLPSASEALDRITDVAARSFEAPIATVSLVGDDRVVFAARVGLELTESTTEPGLCATAIDRSGPYVLIDAQADPRASRHPMVTHEPWIRFYAAVPIVVEGMPLGAVCVMDTKPRYPRPSELATLRDLAGMAAEALDLRKTASNSIASEHDARSKAEAEVDRLGYIANTLQNSLRPSRLPRIPGIEVAAYYRSFASDGVGGDFYDIFPIEEGRWGMFVGDVVGKGVEAAAFTSLARYSLRAAAVIQPDPAAVLAAVNDTVRLDPSGDDTLYCTVAYGELARGADDGWLVTLAVGGHPPPFVIRATRAVDPILEGGTIIGSFADEHHPMTEIELNPGDTLLLYSDGLSELPTNHGWLGDEGVRQALEDHPVRSADERSNCCEPWSPGTTGRSATTSSSSPRRCCADSFGAAAATFRTSRSREGNYRSLLHIEDTDHQWNHHFTLLTATTRSTPSSKSTSHCPAAGQPVRRQR